MPAVPHDEGIASRPELQYPCFQWNIDPIRYLKPFFGRLIHCGCSGSTIQYSDFHEFNLKIPRLSDQLLQVRLRIKSIM
jgi:hypothetical protein